MVPAGEFPNVLLVTVDCLRRDRLSAYGHVRPTTPFLDSLLETSLHATAAHATAPWTGLLSGDLRNMDPTSVPSVLSDDVPVLPQLLGVASAAFLGVWMASLPFRDRFGDTRLLGKAGPKLSAEASRWMGEQERPFCCWVHLGGVHDPLDVSWDLRDAFGPVGSYRATRRWAFTRRDEDVTGDAFSIYRDRRERLYDAAVLAADRMIEGLWASLGDARDRTILVVTADHGEELWDHRDEEIASFADPRGVAGVGHGHTLFQELLLVPLILHGPGIEPGAVEHPTSLVDVVPTLLSATERPLPSGLDGAALGSPPRPVTAQGIAYGHEKRAVIDGQDKLIVSAGDDYERAFRLDATSRMEATETPEAIERLRPLLPPEAVSAAVPSVIEGEMEAHLRGLGYLG
jgi:arylsulfatase A-like enzyme